MTSPQLPIYASQTSAGELHIRVKVVPGAASERIVGILGDRLKIRVQAPPEDGKANLAVRDLIADALGVANSNVVLVTGGSSPLKTFRLHSIPLRWPDGSRSPPGRS